MTRYTIVKYTLRKWPITMAILVLKEISVYHLLDCSSLIDLYQYIGNEDFTSDKEENYEFKRREIRRRERDLARERRKENGMPELMRKTTKMNITKTHV